MKKNIYQSYEKLSSHYEFDVDTKPYNAYLERPEMVNHLPQLSGRQVLDAGCASGWYAAFMAKQGAEVTAIDLSDSMIEAAKRRTQGQNVHAFAHDLTRPLPFENNRFNVIISSLTLHYIKDWQPIFHEFHRILKPGGTFLFSTHHPFMDYENFSIADYYETQLLHDQWKVNGELVDMWFYRRPLNQITHYVNEYFLMKKLIEPLPTKEFKHIHPNGYEKVSTKPNFLIIKAEKPGS
ncbi:class I SAM-dependent methyltransferase [Halobacillus sp. H74]|uniref:class I SAM-dependent methyltransferase n=1 Tax=Halobacillus sp. H74 TaxID=3457436 RepID=UPI003FCE0C1F